MAKNYLQPGSTITLTAPYDVSSGDGLIVGSIFGVAAGDALSGEPVETAVTGVWTLKKTSALAIAAGDLLYWDNTAKEINKTNTNKLVGAAVAAAANPSATVDIRLNGAFVG